MLHNDDEKHAQELPLNAQHLLRERIAFISLLLCGIVFRLIALLKVDNDDVATISFFNRPVVSMSLGKTLFRENMEDFYLSGAYANMVMIFCGCLLVPMVRFSVLAWAYMCPTKSPKLRLGLLLAMDVVGLIMFAEFFNDLIAAIFFSLDFDLLHGALGMKTSMSFFYTFHMGLASNIIATVLTHCLLVCASPHWPVNHYCADKTSLEEEGIPLNLLQRFPVPRNAAWHSVLLLHPVTTHVVNLVFIVCWLHLNFMLAPIFRFEMTGLLSLAEHKQMDFNLWTCVTEFASSQNEDSSFTIGSFASLYTVLMGITPLLLFTMWQLLVWFPARFPVQRACLQIQPYLSSWIGLEVFFLIGSSNVMEMDLLASYLFSDQAPEICGALHDRFGKKCAGV